MQRVRLMSWCRSCLSGVHLPAFAAAEAGLFADQGLELEFVDLAGIPDGTLRGFSTRANAVADGDVDFALTSVAFQLAAQDAAEGRLAARFAAISHRRGPLAALVDAGSDLHAPSDLPGARAARWSMRWFADEYESALAHMGLDAPVTVEVPGDPQIALARGEIDVIPVWMDMAQKYGDGDDLRVRAIALETDVYASGLLAADRLPSDLVAGVRDAFAAGYELQLEQPELGIAAFRRRFPDISEDHIRTNWAVFERYAFGGGAPGSMDASRWEATIAYTAATHGLSTFPGERVYRPELLAPAAEQVPA